jgi:hypothetical protein
MAGPSAALSDAAVRDQRGGPGDVRGDRWMAGAGGGRRELCAVAAGDVGRSDGGAAGER